MTEFDSVIPPGGVGRVTASLDTTSFKGPVSRAIRVTSNEPGGRALTLTMKVHVRTPVEVRPSDRVQLVGRAGAIPPAEVLIASDTERPFAVLGVQADPTLAVDVRAADEVVSPERAPAPAGTPPGESVRYRVTIGAREGVPVGRWMRVVALRTSHPGAETVPIRVHLDVRGDVTVVPERLIVPPLPADAEPWVGHVRISRSEGPALEILGVDSSNPDVEARAIPVREGREYDLRVEYTGGAGRGPFAAMVTVRTNVPGQASIMVPIGGRP